MNTIKRRHTTQLLFFLLWIIIVVMQFTCCHIADAMKVSFFGDGYISMPLQEAKMSTNVRVKFRTRQDNAFLFMASGRTDYCLMRLDMGAISFTYKIERNVVQLRSPTDQPLNDLDWHDVAVQRYENNITLQVDGTIIRKTLPDDMLTLNVHFGAYLGGPGDYTPDFLNDLSSFRGCISDVFYNNINIIKRARDGTGHTVSKGVAWTCSFEFDGSTKDTISFVSRDSYALINKESQTSGDVVSLYFRTMEETGILYYNGGYDYILLELEKSFLRVQYNKDGNLIELITNQTVSNGQWHSTIMRYNSQLIELIVDDNIYQAWHNNSNTSSVINLEKRLFVGGIQDYVRRRLWHKGVAIVDQSFMGCIKDIQINKVPLGFPHMIKSQHLSVSCVWKYPCVEYEPCLKSGYCNQYGVDEFICYCDQSYCIKADFQGPYKIFSETSPTIELLYVSPLQLLEGGTIFLSTRYLNVLLDLHKLTGITDSSIMFHVVQQPRSGQLLQFSVEKNNFVTCRSFTLVDLSTDKIKYTHNGLEYFNDHFTMDLQISGDLQKIPQNILGKHRFILHANITPINDPPQLKIPPNKILRVLEGIEKSLSIDLFNIKDPDSPDNVLIYTILPSANQLESYGRFLVNGHASMTFSQADVNVGKVTFLYNNTATEAFSYQLLLQVSDGIETSDMVLLPVSVHPLELRLINNTGLIMIHKSSLLITPSNLSIGSNSYDENLDVRYEIVKAPQYGAIQRLRQIDATWINVDWFTDSQLLLGHVRYIHNIDLPWQDEFKFIASYGIITTQTFDFRIIFTRLSINSCKPSMMAVNGSREFVLTNEVLQYETIPISTFSRNIIYKIINPTKYGNIYVEGSKKHAKKFDSFTQQDIDKNRIRYRTHRSCYSNFIDYLEFIVSVAECEDVMGKLKIMFTPLESLINKLSYQKYELLYVHEGERALLTKHHFEIRFNVYESLQFLMTNKPKYGTLCRRTIENANENENDSESENDSENGNNHNTQLKIEEFSLEQLFMNEIYYCHDDSESTQDMFDLMILSSKESDFQFIANIEVTIKLINDNAPYRIMERIFHIMRSGIRTLSLDVLQYSDNDINTNLSDIHYIHISCSNGAFYKNGHYVDSFTQDDIANRRIVFQHSGPDVGAASFIVTDHQHEINGLLDIHASEPFVSMLTTNATIVQEGKFVILKHKDFILETNLDMKLDEIYYEVLKPPAYGILMYLGRSRSTDDMNTNPLLYKSSNLTSLANFTQLDVERDRLVYWNTEIASMDKVRYRVKVKNITAESEVIFRIYPSAYWEPLKVKKNQTLYVEESTSILISREILEVVHPNISPGDITFLVTSSPLHGYLEMQSMSFDDEYNCKVFDQSAINTEKMFYIQAGVNQSSDYFIFDVTNGITWLKNLMLRIVIIPEKLYMKANVVSVVEGKTVQLNAADVQPYSEYYRGKILEYIIIVNPTAGYIMAAKSKVKRFTQKQLDQGAIQYIHDGSENASDFMTLVATARNKESVPFDWKFMIIPVNDEQPIVVTNTGLQVWNGGRYVIRSSDLLVRDYDTPPENLTYIVNYIHGGYLARRYDLKLKTHEFTQAEINKEEIFFIHDPTSRHNEISFLVTDGLFNTTNQLLSITIKPIEIVMERNENLHVFPLTKKQILRDHLLYKCSDDDREMHYNVTVPPSLGRLINEYLETGSGSAREISEFTQSDLDNGRIFYEHTAVIIEFRITDSFYFDVIAERSDRLLDQKFNIEISVSSGGLLRFLPVSKLQVDEGDSVPIKLDFSKMLEYLKTRAGINNPELYIEMIQKPNHGRIGWGYEFKLIPKFHPSDFLTKKVYYIHDHSDTLEDTVMMSVYLEQGNIFLCNLSIPVSINPINDQPLQLLTHLPQMTLVEGENRTITRNILLTEDLDTPPDEIVYDVISGPSLGVLKKLSKDGKPQDLLVYSNQFTQADINNDRIVYVHFGNPDSTNFYFTVTDGKYSVAYQMFTINLVPIKLLPSNTQTPISVQQGSTTAVMRTQHIVLETNVQLQRLSYNITNSPLYGIIVLKHQPTLRFNQQLLETGQIQYMQTDLNRSNDTFQVSAYVPGTNYVATLDILVQIEPVIKIQNIIINEVLPPGEKYRLMPQLEADNPLSLKLNKFNPKFLITKVPSTGEIKKIIRSTSINGDNQIERPIATFSYKELRSGVVYFIQRESLDKSFINNDTFDYQLHIKTVQPAQATVKILYQASWNNFNSVTISSSEISINYVAVICAVALVLIIILVIMLIFKFYCVKRYKAKMAKDQPPALPCPPDLTSVSPQRHHLNQHHHYANSETDSVPATGNSTPLPGFSNVPHCKIIPVESYKHDYPDYDIDDGDDEENDAQRMMLPHRYQPNPYNLENDNWSSSCDMNHDFAGYSSIPQSNSDATIGAGAGAGASGGIQTISTSTPPSAPPSNPLLRRNQYWV